MRTLISYQPPDSFWREIIPRGGRPDVGSWRGAVGEYVDANRSLRINIGEITEQGEELGPLA